MVSSDLPCARPRPTWRLRDRSPVQAVQVLAQRHQVTMPIVDAVAQVLFGGDAPQAAIQRLLAREARDEAA